MTFYTTLKRRNESTAREVDALFMERQERERGAHRLEEQIAELSRAAEARIASLPKAAQAEYKALLDENRALASEMATLQAQLEQVNGMVEAAEAAIKRDRVRDEYAIVDKRVRTFVGGGRARAYLGLWAATRTHCTSLTAARSWRT